jgi:hypothetical protein
MLNYYYDQEQSLFQVYSGDLLICEFTQADPMTDQQCEELAKEVFGQYISN